MAVTGGSTGENDHLSAHRALLAGEFANGLQILRPRAAILTSVRRIVALGGDANALLILARYRIGKVIESVLVIG